MAVCTYPNVIMYFTTKKKKIQGIVKQILLTFSCRHDIHSGNISSAFYGKHRSLAARPGKTSNIRTKLIGNYWRCFNCTIYDFSLPWETAQESVTNIFTNAKRHKKFRC